MAATKPDKKIFPEKYKHKKIDYKKLGEHHFFELLDWNPKAIKATAVLWTTKRDLTLVDLYNLICAKNEITTNMKLQELKVEDIGSYQLLRLVNYLPQHSQLTDLQYHWPEWTNLNKNIPFDCFPLKLAEKMVQTNMLEVNSHRLVLNDAVKSIFEGDFSQERVVNNMIFEKYKTQVK